MTAYGIRWESKSNKKRIPGLDRMTQPWGKGSFPERLDLMGLSILQLENTIDISRYLSLLNPNYGRRLVHQYKNPGVAFFLCPFFFCI